jgi:drug/metabolite transporter (DMT)-like permease
LDYLLMLAAIAVFGLQALCFKWFSRGFMKNLASYFLFNFLYFSVVVAVLLPFGLNFAGLHTQTAVLAVIFGFVFIASIFLYMKAMENGPLTLSALMFSFGLLVPILAGAVLWKERLNILQGAALILLLFTFYLGSAGQQAGKKNVNVKWLIFSVSAMLGNGALMTLLKAHQTTLPGVEIREFLAIAFGTAALLSLAVFARRKIRFRDDLSHLKTKAFALLVLGAGISTGIGNLITILLSGRLPAYVQFPVVNGGVVFLSSLLSVFVFREKMTVRAWAGMALGLVALVIICL